MTMIEQLARRLNEADDSAATIKEIVRDHGHDAALQVIEEAHQQRRRDRVVCPALTLLDYSGHGKYLVTLNDYGAGAVLPFDTKDEALAFIAENRGPTN